MEQHSNIIPIENFPINDLKINFPNNTFPILQLTVKSNKKLLISNSEKKNKIKV